MSVPRIALVEDDPSLKKLITVMLRTRGFAVVVWDEREPIDAFVARAAPDLLPLDLRLGALGDAPAIERLSAQAAGRVPTVVSSADAFLLRWLEADLAARGYQVLAKPFGIDALLAAIERGLHQTPPA